VTAVETSVSELRETARSIEDQIGQVIVGQTEVVRGVLVCLLAGGHVMLEGVPGLGKTALVKALCRALDLRYSRIQFTPDLMPADLTGTSVLLEDERGSRHVAFQRGPLFANLVLADEINRATPKTQSALLEAMQEQTVTVGNDLHLLPRPFFVMATQNPIEMEGTYPLPEAELDRFLFKLSVGFPDRLQLAEIFRRTTGDHEPVVERVADGTRILEMQTLVRQVPIADHVADYAIRLVLGTHPSSTESPSVVKRYVRYGASPRAGQAMILAAKVEAILAGNYNVAFEDIQRVALPALRHRVILNFEAEAQRVQADTLLRELLQHVPEEL
jgi:MoxR-like ATPase